MALREAGLVATLEGNEEPARRFFDESLQVAEQFEAIYYIAKTRLARGEAGLKFGWQDAEQQVTEARVAVAQLEDVEGE